MKTSVSVWLCPYLFLYLQRLNGTESNEKGRFAVCRAFCRTSFCDTGRMDLRSAGCGDVFARSGCRSIGFGGQRYPGRGTGSRGQLSFCSARFATDGRSAGTYLTFVPALSCNDFLRARLVCVEVAEWIRRRPLFCTCQSRIGQSRSGLLRFSAESHSHLAVAFFASVSSRPA